MNKGLKQASGDFVLFLGGDDHLISYHILQDIVPRMQISNVCVYHGDVYRCVSKDIYGGKYNYYTDNQQKENTSHYNYIFYKLILDKLSLVRHISYSQFIIIIFPSIYIFANTTIHITMIHTNITYLHSRYDILQYMIWIRYY